MELLESVAYQRQLAQYADSPIDWRLFSGKTFLITGAAGMTGKFLVDLLMYRNEKNGAGMKIIAVGRDERYAGQRFAAYKASPWFSFYRHDLKEPFDHAVTADYILHAASNTHPLQYASDPVGTILTNITGTAHVLDLAARQKNCRTIFLSSVEIYGENRGDTDCFDETYSGYLDCNTLRAGYPEGKRAGEALCQAYLAAKQLDIVIARLSRVYGPTMKETDSKAVAQFIKNAVNGEDILLKSAGSQRYSYACVGDAVDALLYLLLYGKCGEAYNVASADSDITLKELAQRLAEIAGVRLVYGTPSPQEKAGFSKANLAVLSTKKLERLGWKGKTKLCDGLLQTVEILKELKPAAFCKE